MVVVGAALAFVLAANAGSDDVLPTGLRWSAPGGCPPREAFVGALQFRTARAVVVSEAEAPTALLDARLERVGRRYRGRLSLALPTGTTAREVSSPNCASVVEALSLMAALVIDPEHARLGPLPAVLPPAPPPPPAPVAEPPPAPAPVVVDQAPPPLAAFAAPVRDPAAPARGVNAWLVAAVAHGTTAVSGLFDAGGGLSVSLQRGLLVVSVQLAAGSGSTVASANGQGQYPFHLLGAAAVGAGWRWSSWRLGVLAVFQALGFSVSAPQADEPVVAWRWLPSAGPAVQLGWSLGPVEVALGVLGGINLRRDTYLIDPQGGVFVTPLLFLQPSLAVAARF